MGVEKISLTARPGTEYAQAMIADLEAQAGRVPERNDAAMPGEPETSAGDFVSLAEQMSGAPWPFPNDRSPVVPDDPSSLTE